MFNILSMMGRGWDGLCHRVLQPLQDSKKQLTAGSSKDLKKHLLSTLKDASNPVTHSTSGQRAGTA